MCPENENQAWKFSFNFIVNSLNWWSPKQNRHLLSIKEKPLRVFCLLICFSSLSITPSLSPPSSFSFSYYLSLFFSLDEWFDKFKNSHFFQICVFARSGIYMFFFKFYNFYDRLLCACLISDEKIVSKIHQFSLVIIMLSFKVLYIQNNSDK